MYGICVVGLGTNVAESNQYRLEYIVKKEFDVEDRIEFPKKIIFKQVDKYWVIVAPELPNWIVLDEDEKYLFLALLSGKTILQSMDSYVTNKDSNEDIAIEVMTRLLSKIEDVGFYLKAQTQAEIPVENINKLVHINLTNNCNLRCPHCYMSAGLHPECYLNYMRIIDAVVRINELNGKSDIVISGGESLVHPNILNLLCELADNRLTLFTNGTLINKENYEMICKCCDEIQVSFEGISEEKYELIRGKGNYKRVMNAISLLKSKDIKIVLAITLLPLTIDDVRENLVEFVNNLDYNNIEVRINSEIELAGNALTMDLTGYDQKYADAVAFELIEEMRDMNAMISYPAERNIRFTNCGIGTNIVINYDGKIYPCHKFGNICYDINDDTKKIFDDFNEINRRTSNNNIKKCNDCELRYICSGGCRIDNYLRTGSMLKPICDFEYKERQYRRLLLEYLKGQ